MKLESICFLVGLVLFPALYYLGLMYILGKRPFFLVYKWSIVFFSVFLLIFCNLAIVTLAYVEINYELNSDAKAASAGIIYIISPLVMALINKYYLKKDAAF